jgi:drug/metabolite transporter (DMT)-like permease
MSLEAVFAALAGYLVLNQILTGRAVVGCGLILCGVLMVQLVPMMRRPDTHPGPLDQDQSDVFQTQES